MDARCQGSNICTVCSASMEDVLDQQQRSFLSRQGPRSFLTAQHIRQVLSFCQSFIWYRNLLVLGAETISDEKRWREEKDSVPRWFEGSTFVFWRTLLRPSWTKGKGVEAMVCWVELVITQFTKPCVWNWHGLFYTVFSFNINCCARSLLVVIYALPFFFLNQNVFLFYL